MMTEARVSNSVSKTENDFDGPIPTRPTSRHGILMMGA
jgi:hypothetical protein